MKILLITQYYNPVKGAAAKRTGKMAQFLNTAGHDVTVLTGFPSYPTGILAKKYQSKLWFHEVINEIKITRVWELPVSTSDSTIKRLLNLVSFAKTSAWYGLFHHKFDMVIVSSPNFLSGYAGLYSAGKNAKFYFDIRDLWPDSAVQLGVLPEEGFLTNWLKKLEKKYYDRATKIFTATPGIKDHLLTEEIPADKIEVLLNSVDTNLFSPKKVNKTKFELDETDFVCGYIGNMSRVYDLETVIKTAQKLKDYPEIKFVLVGEGESKSKVQVMAENMGLNNVIFIPETPLQELPEIINSFDLGLAPIAKIGVSQESFPSKVSEYLACSVPVLASLAGDMAKTIKEHEVGLIYEPGDAEALANYILKLSRDNLSMQIMSLNARQLALKMFSDEIFSEKLISALG